MCCEKTFGALTKSISVHEGTSLPSPTPHTGAPSRFWTPSGRGGLAEPQWAQVRRRTAQRERVRVTCMNFSMNSSRLRWNRRHWHQSGHQQLVVLGLVFPPPLGSLAHQRRRGACPRSVHERSRPMSMRWINTNMFICSSKAPLGPASVPPRAHPRGVISSRASRPGL